MPTYYHEQDGSRYKIEIREGPDGFVAAWTCLACNVSGVGRGPWHTEAEALGRIKASLFAEHHVTHHVLGH